MEADGSFFDFFSKVSIDELTPSGIFADVMDGTAAPGGFFAKDFVTFIIKE